VTGIPGPNPYIGEHVHDCDEIMMHWGSDYEIPQVLGGEIEFYIGGQPITFNTTTSMYIPKGTPHGPVTWKKFQRPHLQMSILLGNGNALPDWKKAVQNAGAPLPLKTTKFDYEQYASRSPVREIGDTKQLGRQNPSMTYMSRVLNNKANCYIEFGWIYGIVVPSLPEMNHENFDEFVLHFGGDYNNPEALGADMDFGVGGHNMTFSNNAIAYIPKGLRHGPLCQHKVRKPFIEMAVMLGAGSAAEAWARTTRKDGTAPKP